MTTILTSDFKTELGIVKSYIQADIPNTILQKKHNCATTASYKISFETFELQNDWLPNTMEFKTSKGWRWFIQKINNQKENLILYCKIIDPTADMEWGYNSGEDLDAIEIKNKTQQLHIGTEDNDAQRKRAIKEDWMPKRFKDQLLIWDNPNYLSFTEYIDFGFKTTIPELYEGEKIYFHFLVATNPIKQSIQYPNEEDVSTWYAVDQSKEFLDSFLKKV